MQNELRPLQGPSARHFFYSLAHAICILFLLSPAAAYAFNAMPGEFIIKLKGKHSSVSSSSVLNKVHQKGGQVGISLSKLNMHKIQLQADQDMQSVLNELRADPSVEYVEPNYILTRQNTERSENQTLSLLEARSMSMGGDSNNFMMSESSFIQNLAPVGVEQAWTQLSSLDENPEKPIVAVIDTGVDYNHEVFVQTGAIWINPREIPGNGIDDDGNGYVDDVRGWNFAYRNNNPMDDDAKSSHGTHVAGIVLGAGQDIFAFPLEEAKVRIMPIKFMNQDGAGSTADAIAAIYYAVNNGAQVINNSWGGGNYSQALHDALAFAYNQKVLVVNAAGNYRSDNDHVAMYPANYPVPGAISVGASTDWDTLASFSNFGASNVHVASPGVAILSTRRNNTAGFMSGTSMAAPFVAGIAALVLREASELSGYQVRNLIMNSSNQLSALNTRIYNSNRVHLLNAVTAAKLETNTSFFQPQYQAMSHSADRGPASQSAGCGTVGSVLSGMSSSAFFKGGGPQGPSSSLSAIMIFVGLMLLPLLVWFVISQRNQGINKRRFDRFVMNSEIRVMADGRELVGQMKTISLGGVSFQADALLEKGGTVTLQIAGPEGGESVQVEGHIVWNEANHAYGVQFDHARDSVVGQIHRWTQKLIKA